MSSGNREIEVTFVVQSDDPLAVVARLESLQEFAGHRLHPEPPQHLRDRYFDLPERGLRARGYALRLRQLEARWLLCLKGRSRVHGPWVDRLEIEGPLADPALHERLGAELGRDWPATLRGSAPSRFAADPLAALTGAGFLLLQDRETLRRPRHLLAAGSDPVAELVIDTVTYIAAGTAMRHHEVEIEAGPEMEGVELSRLGDALGALFPVELRPWPLSKLRTGLALEALARSHGPAALVDSTGDLSSHAYTLLRETLHRGHPDPS